MACLHAFSIRRRNNRADTVCVFLAVSSTQGQTHDRYIEELIGIHRRWLAVWVSNSLGYPLHVGYMHIVLDNSGVAW